jgi:hypothetical protein
MRQLLWVYEALDRFVEGDARRDEDGEHDGVAGPLLRTFAAQKKGGTDRYRSEGVTCVVDQVGEKCHGAGKDKITACTAAVAPSTPRLIATALTPARERTIEGSTRPCE